MGASDPGQRTDSGEIALIDADRLDDHAGVAAKAPESTSAFGDDAEGRAIANVADKLRRAPSSARLSDEQREEQAVDLYNRLCDPIRSGEADETLIAQAAALFGEDGEALRERLLAEKTEDTELAEFDEDFDSSDEAESLEDSPDAGQVSSLLGSPRAS